VPVPGAESAPLLGLASGALEAQERQSKVAERLNLPLEVVLRRSKLRCRLVPPGAFMMGSATVESRRAADEGPVHRVKVLNPLYVGKFEVTRAQWRAVMGKEPPGPAATDQDLPVTMVSWDDCQEFCRRLAAVEALPEGTFRLLTEAEWEYACRAGTETRYCCGDDDKDLVRYACYAGGGEAAATATGPQRAGGNHQANAWGLCDMHGNVAEWCADWYDSYAAETAPDPAGPRKGSERVVRGGSFATPAVECRSASRANAAPAECSDRRGFRIALSAWCMRTATAPATAR
jgi:formylglycine-generating enzyme required for sulfatase activity